MLMYICLLNCYFHCLNSKFLVVSIESICTISGVAKVGHTGVHALPTWPCAPPRY